MVFSTNNGFGGIEPHRKWRKFCIYKYALRDYGCRTKLCKCYFSPLYLFTLHRQFTDTRSFRISWGTPGKDFLTMKNNDWMVLAWSAPGT